MSSLNLNSTLCEIFDECGCAADVLMQLGIDCTLHKYESIKNVCTRYDIDALTLLELILTRDVPLSGGEDREWAEAPLDELVDHLIAHHHEYLRRLLPMVQLLADKAVREQGLQHPELPLICEHFIQVRHDLEKHFIDEEQVMFPAIRQLAAVARGANTGYGLIDSNVDEVRHDFDEEAAQFNRFRQLTHHYHAPDNACTAYQALVENLAELERELERHYHLENDVLIPRALHCEEQLKQR